MSGTPTPSKPWYRHFWVWFVIAIPVSAMVMGFTTLYYAVSTSDGLVVDDYYRQGLAINRTLDRDRRAAELGLSARVDFLGEQLRVVLQGVRPEQLHVRLLHPTLAHHDVDILVWPEADGTYRATLPELVPASWYVLVEPAERAEWRLLGRIRIPGERSVEIAPSKP